MGIRHNAISREISSQVCWNDCYLKMIVESGSFVNTTDGYHHWYPLEVPNYLSVLSVVSKLVNGYFHVSGNVNNSTSFIFNQN